MKRVLMNIVVTLSAIVFLANQSFAQTAQTLPYTDDFSANSGWTYANTDDYGRNSWLVNEDRLFVRQYNGYYIAAYDTDMCATSYVYRNIIDNLNITEVNAPTPAEPESAIDTSKYITLTVSQGDTILLRFQASANNTPIKIESGSWDTIIIADTNTIFKQYKSQSTIMTIYGDIKKFVCRDNYTKVSAIDASHNTALTYLECRNNSLTSLNVSGLTNLQYLSCCYNQLTILEANGLTNLQTLLCFRNQLTSLDVSGLTNLQYLSCYKNQLASLNAYGCTNLKELDCDGNQLTSLDVSGLTNLKYLICDENQLASLNISGCDSLYVLYCYCNLLSTQAIDNLYCQLPDRTSREEQGGIIISLDSTNEIVLATNKTNATDKNWVVLWGDTTDNEVYEVVTNGAYVCGEEPSALANIEEQTITLYPNPAKDEIVLKGLKGEMITVFDADGRIVKQENINERLNIRDLKSGVYYLQVNKSINKFIKQ